MHSNYRPVSNLTFTSNLVEKAAALDQFLHHTDTRDLMLNYLSAYRAHYSSETAIIKLTIDILCAMENHEITVMNAIDLSAAFDMVDHQVHCAAL